MAQRNAPLRLRFAEGELTISAQSQDVGETSESLPVAYTASRSRSASTRSSSPTASTPSGRHGAPEADQPASPRPDHVRRRCLLVPDHADQARRLIVREVTLRDFRSYARLELDARAGSRARHRAPTAPARRTCSSRSTRHTGLLAAHALRRQLIRTAPRHAHRADGSARPSRCGRVAPRAASRSAPASTARRCGRPSSCAASSRRSSSRPTGWSSSRAGRRRGVPISTARSAGSTRRGHRSRSTTQPPSGQRNAALRRIAAGRVDPRGARAVDGAGRRARGAARRRPPRRDRPARPGFAERAGELGPPGGRARLRRRAADGGVARGAPRPRPRAGRDRARPAPRRHR